MRKILLFLSLLCCCSEVIAKCDYSGSAGQAIFNISPKIATDPTIPVGTV
ncbi:fimbrial protein, partial [Klebsiella variicola]